MAATAGLGRFETTVSDEYWHLLEGKRNGGDVVWDDELGAWLVFSYELIRETSLDDDEVWRSIWIRAEDDQRGVSTADWEAAIGPSPKLLPLLEGDAYSSAHRWYFKAFSPKLLEQWGETIVDPIVHRLVDDFAARGRVELCGEFCDRVGARCSAAVVGFPATDEFADRIFQLHRYRTRLMQQHLALDSEFVANAVAARRELVDLVLPYVLERGDAGGDDMISMIWRDAHELFGDSYDEVDVASTAAQMVASGTGSISTSVGNALYVLMTTPGLEDDVRDGGADAIRTFAEEGLRLYAPVQLRFRWAKCDVVVGGVQIRKGDMVCGVYSMGNRDGRRYADAWNPHLDRSAPRAHFGFGAGPRTCPGQALARFELQRIYTVLFDRLRNLRLDPDAEQPVYAGGIVRRWRPLHALFDVTARARSRRRP